MRVCVVKANNQLIEMQSNATEGTLLQNAISSGYSADDVEEREVTGEEYRVIISNQPKTTDEQIVVLNAEYDPQRKALWDYLNLAVNYWQDADAAASIRVELDALEAEYNAKAEVIYNG